jgi:hypothetical protein
MAFAGTFTGPDRTTISKAAALAERLIQQYFNFGEDQWQRNPYGIFTCREAGMGLYQPDVFAQVIRYRSRGEVDNQPQQSRYGIVLQDPNILLALLRSKSHDLWTLGLFILTHELTHIIRFTRYDVDFFAGPSSRDKEEKLVQGVTKEILKGVTNTNHILSLYEKQAELLHST